VLLVGGFVRLGVPGFEDRGRVVAEQLAHGDATGLVWCLEFAVDESVVEPGGGGIGGSGSVKNVRRASPVDGAEAHGAGFAGGVEITMIELEGFEALASFADGDDFGVGGGVVGGSNAIDAGGDECAVLGDDRGKGPAAVADVFESESDGLAHEVDWHW